MGGCCTTEQSVSVTVNIIPAPTQKEIDVLQSLIRSRIKEYANTFIYQNLEKLQVFTSQRQSFLWPSTIVVPLSSFRGSDISCVGSDERIRSQIKHEWAHMASGGEYVSIGNPIDDQTLFFQCELVSPTTDDSLCCHLRGKTY